MKILVIAPHPDDEVLGCGGTIAKYVRKGDSVYLCIITKVYGPEWSKEFLEERPKEIKKTNKILGIKKTYLLGYPTVKLDTIPQKELVESISRVIKDVNPKILFIPHKGDSSKDHRLVFEYSIAAARPIHSKVEKILSYEVLSETDWGQAIEAFLPNVYQDISLTFTKKLEAMKAYKSELRPYPHSRSLEAIRALAGKRGSESGLKFAEAFILIREIKN